jgi:hypothetical protein
LDELKSLVRRGKVDAVVTFKLDRLARSLVHLAQIIAEMQAHCVALVVPSQGIDTSNANPAAMLQINVHAAVAQVEREIITERVNVGLRAAKERGVRLGRPPRTRKHVPLVAALLREGLSAAEIGRRLVLRVPPCPLAAALVYHEAVGAELESRQTESKVGKARWRTSVNTRERTDRLKPGQGKTGCRDLRVAQATEQMSRGERGNPNLKSDTPNPILP